jgi:hypothetical protein
VKLIGVRWGHLPVNGCLKLSRRFSIPELWVSNFGAVKDLICWYRIGMGFVAPIEFLTPCDLIIPEMIMNSQILGRFSELFQGVVLG